MGDSASAADDGCGGASAAADDGCGSAEARAAAAVYARAFTNPLRFTPLNMLLYEQGRYSLVLRDLEAVLGGEAADRLDGAVGPVLVRAYDARREVISLKKICLRLFNEGRSAELALVRLCAFFFVDDEATGVAYEDGKRGRYRDHAWVASQEHYEEVCRALHDCRGALLALQDVRDVTKWACCLPRHPDVPRPPRLRGLRGANSLARKLLWRVRKVEPDLAKLCLDDARVDDDDVSDEVVCRGGLAVLEAALEGVDGVSDGARAFALKSAVCRGGAKACAISAQVSEYGAALDGAPEALEACAARLDGARAAKEADAALRTVADGKYALLSRALQCSKHASTLKSAAVVLRGARAACAAILEGGGDRTFVCGDTGAAALPAKFRGLAAGVQRAVAVVAKLEAEVERIVKTEGWPIDAKRSGRVRAARLHLDGDAACWKCEGTTFQRAWARDGACWGCERDERAAGRCPRGSTGCPVRKHARAGASDLGFCPHAKRCVACDGHSCAACRLLRGDGDDVARAYRDLADRAPPGKPPFLLLDFDRTLCSTRNGADPMAPSTKGSKKAVSADEALVDLLAQAPPGTAFIVTRNSRREAIEAYLETLHLGATVAVRSVKREHKDKADVALELPGAGISAAIELLRPSSPGRSLGLMQVIQMRML